MKITSKKVSLFLILLLIVSLISYIPHKDFLKEDFSVHYIDVGQGDATLIKGKDKNLLIDSGPLEGSRELIKYLKKVKVKKIDYIIATHAHLDHIGAMPSLIGEFPVDYFFITKNKEKSSFYMNLLKNIKDKNIKLKILSEEGILPIDLGKNSKVYLLSKYSEDYDNINNTSPLLKIYYGKTSFLFTGDMEREAEKLYASLDINLKSDVLKVAHHGSDTSSTEEFLNKVNPKVSIISSGLDNPYGHPSKETLKKLSNLKSKIFKTYEDGNIILSSNGNFIKKHKN